jgi:hypothetical protein
MTTTLTQKQRFELDKIERNIQRIKIQAEVKTQKGKILILEGELLKLLAEDKEEDVHNYLQEAREVKTNN